MAIRPYRLMLEVGQSIANCETGLGIISATPGKTRCDQGK